MSVDVDYGAGHTIFSVLASEAYTQPTSDQVQDRGDTIYGYLLDLEGAADTAAEEAIIKLNELKEFSASVPTVSFIAPPAPHPTLSAMPPLDDSDLDQPIAEHASIDRAFEYTLTNAVSQTWEQPDTPVYVAPEAPNIGAVPDTPPAPSDWTFPPVTAPDITLPDFVTDSLQVPSLQNVDVTPSEIAPIETLVLDVDFQALIDVINRMKSFDPTPPVLPEYMYLLPEIFEVTGRMAAGDPVVDYLSLLVDRDNLLNSTKGSLTNAFARRDLSVPLGAQSYDVWLASVISDKMDLSDKVFTEVAKEDAVNTAMQLGTAAHRMLVDIETALYDLDFQLAKAAVNGQLEKARMVQAVYSAEVVLMNSRIAEYNALVVWVEARAKLFEVEASQAEVIGQANTVTASLFGVTEGVKGVAADVFKSQVQAEKAKLSRYKALISSYKSAVAEAQGVVASYSGTVARYSAEIENASIQYDAYASRAQGTQFDNAARVSVSQAEQAQLRSLAALADASASSASVKALQLQTKAAVRETAYVHKALTNETIAVDLQRQGSQFSEDIANYVTNLVAQSADMRSSTTLGQVISRYAQVAQESIGRAAQLSQTANIQLSQAYRTVYDAAGRAGAAVASGKLSGFRASAVMQAGDSLSASNTYNVGFNASGVNTFSQSDKYTT
jgi:hypothetical protein